MSRLRWTCLLGLLLTAAGCKTTGGPSWLHPGSAPQQQARARTFDPYPETNVGPDVTGVRPREYSKSIPEVDRARQLNQTDPLRAGWLPWNWGKN